MKDQRLRKSFWKINFVRIKKQKSCKKSEKWTETEMEIGENKDLRFNPGVPLLN